MKGMKEPLSFSELSEGEQQLITVLGLLIFTGGHDSLFLLDEPDTHLNPAWDVKYLSYLRDFVPNQNTSHLIMVTHNPLAIAELEKEQVQIMWRDANFDVYADTPDEHPRGMGYAGILTSDMFGFGSTLDEFTTNLIRERREILGKQILDEDDKRRLTELNTELESLGYSTMHWDSDYGEYLRLRRNIYPEVFESKEIENPAVIRARKEKAKEIVRKILEKEAQERDSQ